MIICFEGPSAVGKTTLAAQLSADFHVVPEVNELFGREQGDGWWYLGRQVERWQRCLLADRDSILDGDIFQPLWYHWIYGDPRETLSQDDVHQFYQNEIQHGRIRFPDLYVICRVDIDELTRRKESDGSRTRRNFNKHLRMIQPQARYFEFLSHHTDIPVAGIELTSPSKAIKQVTDILRSYRPTDIDYQRNYRTITQWLTKTPAFWSTWWLPILGDLVT